MNLKKKIVLLTTCIVFALSIQAIHIYSDFSVQGSEKLIEQIDTISIEEGKFYLNRYESCNKLKDLQVYVRLHCPSIDSSKYVFAKIYKYQGIDSSQEQVNTIRSCYNSIALKTNVYRYVEIQNGRVYVVETNSTILRNRHREIIEEITTYW